MVVSAFRFPLNFQFYSSHCKALEPEFETAAVMLKEANSKAFLAKVDCAASKDLCDDYGVAGLPTLFWMK